MVKGVYNPKAVIPHAASLHQASAHCAIFPTAASRRSLGRVSVPMWPSTLSGRLPVDALVGHYPTNKLIGRGPILHRKTFHHRPRRWSYPVLDPVSRAYPEVQGRSPTCYSPVRHSCTPASGGLTVRLACVKHAASVRPEPGSNSPQKLLSEKPENWQKEQTTNQDPKSPGLAYCPKNRAHPKPLTGNKPGTRSSVIVSRAPEKDSRHHHRKNK